MDKRRGGETADLAFVVDIFTDLTSGLVIGFAGAPLMFLSALVLLRQARAMVR